MNFPLKLFFILGILFFIPGIIYTQDKTTEARDWEMAVLKKNNSKYESIAFQQPITMTRRDAFQLYFSFNMNGFCYVIQEDDEGRLPFVYKSAVSIGQNFTLPEKDRDFLNAELPGTNRFHVIICTEPRANLEKLIDQHGKEAVTVSLERSLLSEVLAVKKNISAPWAVTVIVRVQ